MLGSNADMNKGKNKCPVESERVYFTSAKSYS